jgi:hypothetical protein
VTYVVTQNSTTVCRFWPLYVSFCHVDSTLDEALAQMRFLTVYSSEHVFKSFLPSVHAEF